MIDIDVTLAFWGIGDGGHTANGILWTCRSVAAILIGGQTLRLNEEIILPNIALKGGGVICILFILGTLGASIFNFGAASTKVVMLLLSLKITLVIIAILAGRLLWMRY